MKKITFEKMAGLWLAEKKHFVKKSTYAAYSLTVAKHLVPEFGRFEDITEDLVQQFVFSKLDSGLSQKSVKDMLVVLKMVLKYGVKNGFMERRDIDVRFPTERERKDVEVLSLENQQKIMRYLRSNFSFMNLGIYICLCSGLRIGEICALKWKDIDLTGRVIHITKTIQRIYLLNGNEGHTEIIVDTAKTINSMRSIPIPKELLSVLRPLKKIVCDDFYVLTNSSDPTEPRTYRNYYNRLLSNLGVPKLKFHGLRHSFATRCIESKCDYKTLSVLLGHSKISTTLDLYVHPNFEQKQQCVEQMFRRLR